MTAAKKSLTLAFIVILATSSLVLLQMVSAQVPKPSVPEFTASFVDRSYDVPESTATNQYTGETVVTPAHRVQNYTIEVAIKNQPYTPTEVQLQPGGSTWMPDFRYDVNVKGHFAQNWTIMYAQGEGPKQSNSDFTVMTYELVSSPSAPEQGFELRSLDAGSNCITGIPLNTQLDFRVRATIGVVHRGFNPDATDQLSMYPYVYDGEISDWATTQTVTIPSIGISPNPTATPLQPGTQTSVEQNNVDWTQVALFSAVGAIVVLLAVIGLVYRRQRNNKIT